MNNNHGTKIPVLLLVFFASTQGVMCQADYVLYLGPDMNTRFIAWEGSFKQPMQKLGIKGLEAPVVNNSRRNLSIEGFDTFKIADTSTQQKAFTLQPTGSIGSAISQQVGLTKNNDSIYISYSTNLVAGKAHQAAIAGIHRSYRTTGTLPSGRELYDLFDRTEMEGSISLNAEKIQFYTKEEKKGASGWLTLGNDTLHLRDAAKVIRTGNSKVKKKPRQYEAYQLMRGGTCVAAIDYSALNPLIYIDKKLTNREKILIVAFFITHSFRISLQSLPPLFTGRKAPSFTDYQIAGSS